MKTTRLEPQTLIRTAVQDAERALRADQGDRVLADADVARLPAALRDVVDDFRAAGHGEVRTNDVLGALRQALEAGLRQSLTRGELVSSELSEELGALLSFSSVGVQVQKAIAERASAAIADFASAAQEAQLALAEADLSVASQVRVLKELARAARLARSEAPDHALLLDGIAKDRAKIVRHVVDHTVKSAERALAERPQDAGAKRQLAAALEAAIEVHVAVNPKSVRAKALRAELAKLDGAVKKKPAQPFFARFLENQNRGPAQQQQQPELAVTMKYPSDNEDGGADPIATTKKFPSDAEDAGVDGPGDGGVVTMKAPSDHEDGGVDDGGDGGIVTTMKAPSDHEDGGVDTLGVDGGGVVTEKYPSDAEDGGVDGGGGDYTTLKYPSDNEDGGVDEGGDGGVMVTMKFPSDNEDGGGGDLGAVTLKYPSDNEDGGTDVGAVDGPTDGPAESAAARRIADSILAVWQGGGAQAVSARIAELEDIGMRARFTAEGLREHNAELACLRTLLGGVDAVTSRIREIEQLMMVALMTPEASQELQLELDVLRLLAEAL